ncbi:MAG: glycogen synthase GlgA [Desulfobacterota bacterium]|jgi:starch synthase|nr:glycogen synthase GlgA [Thermodesulfobacteriota bacterium]
MKVLFATPEVAPFSRAGGLADVSQALPLYVSRLGHEVRVVTPKYRLAQPLKPALKPLEVTLEVPISWMKKPARVFQASLREGVPVYLIGRDDLYDREGLYGNEYGDYQDNAERFIFFSRAVLELCAALPWSPDVIHCQDWQTGLIPVYLKTLYRAQPQLQNTASLFTIHNLGYQGLFWHYDLHLTGLGWELFTPQGLEFFGKINLMKGGIIFADILNTVSPTYRKEILTPENGFGLEGVLQGRGGDLYAVLNGVDYEIWNPENDPHLPAPFSGAALENKKLGKAQLQERFQLKRKAECPIVAVISRLLDRKGLDLIRQVFPKLMDLEMEVILMGQGVDQYQNWAQDLAKKYPGQIGLEMNYQDNLAHQIQGGADMLLMPSRYEPCGLDQMYALRYGTIPIVRGVGGLDDTVEDYNPQTDQGTGFKFRDYEADKLLQTVQRALAVYRDKPRWVRLMQRGMAQDFSWARSALAYQELYQKAAAGKRNQ